MADPKELTSTLTVRLGEKHSQLLEAIKEKHGLTASTKAIVLMIETFTSLEEELQNLKVEKSRLQRELSEFRNAWSQYKNSQSQLDRLSNGKI